MVSPSNTPDAQQAEQAPEAAVASAPALPFAGGELKAHGSRYRIYGEIASGGMAVVQYGRLAGPMGFARGVAIKRLHAQFARDPNFVSMFLDEARLAARIQHANVVPTLDVIAQPGEVSVIMEYVPGESLAGLLSIASARGESVPVRIATTLLAGTLHGLQAAHETCNEDGELLHIVHRDVSPQNILVGSDGVARLLDFGIAKAQGRSRVTPTGELKGKLAYMAVEQYRGEWVDRRVDVYGASVVLWEALTGCMLFDGPNDAAVARAVMQDEVPPPSQYAPHVPEALDRIVLKGLSRNRDERFLTAKEMALALEREVGVVPQSEVSDWVHGLAGDLLAARAEAVRQMQLRGEQRPESDTAEGGTRRIPVSSELDSAVKLRSDTRESVRVAAPVPAAPSLPARSPVRPLAWMLSVLTLLTVLGGAAYLAMAPRSTSPASGRPATERLSLPPPLPQAPRPTDLTVPKADTGPAQASPTPAPATVSDGDWVAEPALDAPEAETKKQPESERTERKQESSRKKERSKKPSGVDCTEPVVVDAMGIRRVKRECLRAP